MAGTRQVTRPGVVSREVADARDGIGDVQPADGFTAPAGSVIYGDASGNLASYTPADGSGVRRSGNGLTGVPQMSSAEAEAGTSTAPRLTAPARLHEAAAAVLATTIITDDEATISAWDRLYVIGAGVSTVNIAAPDASDDGARLAILNLSGDTVTLHGPVETTWINDSGQDYELDDRHALIGTYVHASTGWDEAENGDTVPAAMLNSMITAGTDTTQRTISAAQAKLAVDTHAPGAVPALSDEDVTTGTATTASKVSAAQLKLAAQEHGAVAHLTLSTSAVIATDDDYAGKHVVVTAIGAGGFVRLFSWDEGDTVSFFNATDEALILQAFPAGSFSSTGTNELTLPPGGRTHLTMGAAGAWTDTTYRPRVLVAQWSGDETRVISDIPLLEWVPWVNRGGYQSVQVEAVIQTTSTAEVGIRASFEDGDAHVVNLGASVGTQLQVVGALESGLDLSTGWVDVTLELAAGSGNAQVYGVKVWAA